MIHDDNGQQEHTDPFFGTWKLVPTQSSYQFGLPSQSRLYRIEPEGPDLIFTAELITPEGQPARVVYHAVPDDQDHPFRPSRGRGYHRDDAREPSETGHGGKERRPHRQSGNPCALPGRPDDDRNPIRHNTRGPALPERRGLLETVSGRYMFWRGESLISER